MMPRLQLLQSSLMRRPKDARSGQTKLNLMMKYHELINTIKCSKETIIYLLLQRIFFLAVQARIDAAMPEVEEGQRIEPKWYSSPGFSYQHAETSLMHKSNPCNAAMP